MNFHEKTFSQQEFTSKRPHNESINNAVDIARKRTDLHDNALTKQLKQTSYASSFAANTGLDWLLEKQSQFRAMHDLVDNSRVNFNKTGSIAVDINQGMNS